ncbi:MAG: hypothetical protein AAB865_02500 [Patescibacteria group bacterium]
MADEFDRDRAAQVHHEVILAAQRIRDGITKDVIDYYYETPNSEEQEREYREGMRKFLRLAAERIDELLQGRLSGY